MALLRIMFPVGLSVSLVLGGCFSPNQKVESADDSAGDEGGSTTGRDSDSSEMTAAETTSNSGSSGSTADPTTNDEETTGGLASTTMSPGDASSTDTMEEPPPGCGDGEVASDEECDEGEDNGEGECTELCTLAVCGDGIISLDEVCDEGSGNGTELDDCAPDCSKLVDAKTITVSANYSTNGDMGGPGAVEHVDARCEAAGLAGYKAMFTDGTNRRASVTPYAGDGQIDWVLTPWTRYLNEDGELVWVTDASALLGVLDGEPQSLLAPIGEESRAYTGLQPNWLSELSDDCLNWTNSTGASTYMGEPNQLALDRVLAGVTPDISPMNCGSSVVVYCVAQ